jgi:hypothetical protein
VLNKFSPDLFACGSKDVFSTGTGTAPKTHLQDKLWADIYLFSEADLSVLVRVNRKQIIQQRSSGGGGGAQAESSFCRPQ